MFVSVQWELISKEQHVKLVLMRIVLTVQYQCVKLVLIVTILLEKHAKLVLSTVKFVKVDLPVLNVRKDIPLILMELVFFMEEGAIV